MDSFILAVCAVYYLTLVLLYKEKTSHFGPFPSKTKFTYDTVTHRSQPVTWFDYFRVITPFNPYKSTGELWEIDKERMEVWSCPVCLCFWITFLVTIPLSVSGLGNINLLELILFHVAVSGATSFLFKVGDLWDAVVKP